MEAHTFHKVHSITILILNLLAKLACKFSNAYGYIFLLETVQTSATNGGSLRH